MLQRAVVAGRGDVVAHQIPQGGDAVGEIIQVVDDGDHFKGIQDIEEKMRIDLGLEGGKLRLLLQHPGFVHPVDQLIDLE